MGVPPRWDATADGPQKRRILFAPIVKITAEEASDLVEGNFGRFPLPAARR